MKFLGHLSGEVEFAAVLNERELCSMKGRPSSKESLMIQREEGDHVLTVRIPENFTLKSILSLGSKPLTLLRI
jgi:hypothetical protein